MLLFAASAQAEPLRFTLKGMAETVAFSPDGNSIAAGGADRMVRIWDTKGKQLQELPIYDAGEKTPGVTCVAFSPDGKALAVAASLLKPVSFWDVASGAKLDQSLELNSFKQFAWGVAYSPDGTSLATAGPSGLELWDLKSKNRSFVKPLGERFQPRKVVFSPDGSLLATEAGRIFKTESGDKFWYDNELAAKAIAFSSDGRFLITAGRVGGYGEFHIWDIKTRKDVLRHKEDRPGTFYSMAISPIGNLIATGGWPGFAIKLWDVDTAALKGELKGHTDRVVALSFSPDGKKLVSASLDKSILIWDLEMDVVH